ncbi:MAG: asparagine synthase (glutamine-hydrolyzing) [candidate division Zixibacteria bacterium]|nr:asparagine synthase (glutamine-hydrolyzing) [candidate division Zixibacteria bacterium]
MCGIAGIVTAKNRELAHPLRNMLETIEHRGPDGAGYVIGDVCERGKTLDALEFNTQKTNVALGHVRLQITGGHTGVQPFQSTDGRISLLHNGEIYNYEELSDELERRTKLKTDSDSEVVLRLIEEEYDGDLVTAVEAVLPRLDGVYAMVVSDRKTTIVARDKIGVRPLYYTIDGDTVSFASERRPLTTTGLDASDTERLAPAHMLIARDGSHEVRPFWTPDSLTPTKQSISDMTEAIGTYGKAMEAAVRKRVQGHDHVGVIFSGGIDSFLVAYLIERAGVPFTCYAAGRTGSTDIQWSLELCKKFGWDIKTADLTTEDVEELVPEVMQVIEDHSLIQVEVAIPIYAAVRNASRNGERVILTGQGADELFGGYAWYSTIVEQEGYDSFLSRAWEDTILLYRECLEREDKISMAHSVELRVPFLDPNVIQVAYDIDPTLKIYEGGDDMGKRVHRDYCLSIGIPHNIAYRTKEAAQHGANIHEAIEELALKSGITAERLNELGYDPDTTVEEQLGSCCRYGHKYGQENMWRAAPHVQFYLDAQASRLGRLSPDAYDHWARIHERLVDDAEAHVAEDCPAC